jgi:hypothetical protein
MTEKIRQRRERIIGDICYEFRSGPSRAERNFKKEERARDGRQAMIEYEVQARATRARTERLKALRLAEEAQAQTEEPPAKPTKRRPVRREK